MSIGVVAEIIMSSYLVFNTAVSELEFGSNLSNDSQYYPII